MIKKAIHFQGRTLISIALAVVLAVVGSWFLSNTLTSPLVVSAVPSDNLSGFAWAGDYDPGDSTKSSAIGWISFNCTNPGENCVTSNYGVRIDETNRFTLGGLGNFSGSAWSSMGIVDGSGNPTGLGWISFDRSKTGTPPSDDVGLSQLGSPLAYLDWGTGRVYGWARALAGCQDIPGVPVPTCIGRTNPITGNPINATDPGLATGGWDGWIKLSDSSWTPGVSLNTVSNEISGYAWGGGTILGWISFNCSDNGICGTYPYKTVFGPLFPPPAGSCGSASGIVTASAPTTNLCSTSGQTASAVTKSGTPWVWGWTCSYGGTVTSCSAPLPQCSDGIDNDGDGKIDVNGAPPDPDCTSASDNNERNFNFKEF